MAKGQYCRRQKIDNFNGAPIPPSSLTEIYVYVSACQCKYVKYRVRETTTNSPERWSASLYLTSPLTFPLSPSHSTSFWVRVTGPKLVGEGGKPAASLQRAVKLDLIFKRAY